jgi:hypothetical protein
MRNSKQLGTRATPLFLAALLVGCASPAPEPLAEMTPLEATVAAPTATAVPPTVAPTVTLTVPATEQAATPPPVTQPAATQPVTGGGEEPSTQADTGTAVVESLDVRILESFPVQVQAVVTGYLPDGCTTIAATDAVQEGSNFRIRIITARPQDAICTMALVPFEQIVPLATAGLPAGEYQVVVNDLAAAFTLP